MTYDSFVRDRLPPPEQLPEFLLLDYTERLNAAAELLKGVPLAPSSIKTELTTPTGAAILTTVVSEYTATPTMTIERIGTGSGTKDFLEQPNILRLMVGVTTQGPQSLGLLVGALLCVAGGTLTKWTAPAFFYLTVIPLLAWRRQLALLFGWRHLLAVSIAAFACAAWAFPSFFNLNLLQNHHSPQINALDTLPSPLH